jgi:crossover junction endodeoxyribonuclease RuvC
MSSSDILLNKISKLQAPSFEDCVLGIDPGTATTGWAIVSLEKTPKSIAYGHIETSPKLTDTERLVEISQDLKEICKKYKPREGAVEKLFYFKNQKTIITVAQSRGAVLLTLKNLGLTLSEYTPLQIKQSITGYGRAEKHQMQQMVKSILGLSEIPKPDDVADALAVAICHIHSRRYNKDTQ